MPDSIENYLPSEWFVADILQLEILNGERCRKVINDNRNIRNLPYRDFLENIGRQELCSIAIFEGITISTEAMKGLSKADNSSFVLELCYLKVISAAARLIESNNLHCPVLLHCLFREHYHARKNDGCYDAEVNSHYERAFKDYLNQDWWMDTFVERFARALLVYLTLDKTNSSHSAAERAEMFRFMIPVNIALSLGDQKRRSEAVENLDIVKSIFEK